MPWTLIFNIALKILGFGLDRAKASREAKKRFLEFVSAMEGESLASVNLNESDRKQLDELKDRRAKLDEAQNSDN